MTLGKPLVASRAGAAPEVIGDAGLLVEPDNPAALAASLDRLLTDPALRASLGERAAQRATRYSVARMIDGYVQIMDELLKR